MTFRSLTFSSRRDLEQISGLPEHVLISISSPPSNDKRHRRALPQGPWRDVLYLEFHDTQNPHIYENGLKLADLTDEQGYEILKFLKKHEAQNLGLWINCEGGISRSSGIVMFVRDMYVITEYYKFQDATRYVLSRAWDQYNRHVHNTLVKLYGQCRAGKGKLRPEDLPAVPQVEETLKERSSNAAHQE